MTYDLHPAAEESEASLMQDKKACTPRRCKMEPIGRRKHSMVKGAIGLHKNNQTGDTALRGNRCLFLHFVRGG